MYTSTQPQKAITAEYLHSRIIDKSLLDSSISIPKLLDAPAEKLAEAFNKANEFTEMVYTPTEVNPKQYRKTLVKTVSKVNEDLKDSVYMYNKLYNEYLKACKQLVIHNNYTHEHYTAYNANSQKLQSAIDQNEKYHNIIISYEKRWSVSFGNWFRNLFKTKVKKA